MQSTSILILVLGCTIATIKYTTADSHEDEYHLGGKYYVTSNEQNDKFDQNMDFTLKHLDANYNVFQNVEELELNESVLREENVTLPNVEMVTTEREETIWMTTSIVFIILSSAALICSIILCATLPTNPLSEYHVPRAKMYR